MVGAEYDMNETTVLVLSVALALLLGVLIGLGVWLRARSAWERADRSLRDTYEQETRSLLSLIHI